MEKSAFLLALGVILPFFYLKGPFFFSDKVWNPITNYLGTKKWVSHFRKWLFDVKNSKITFFWVKYPLFDEEHLLFLKKIDLLLDLTLLLKKIVDVTGEKMAF